MKKYIIAIGLLLTGLMLGWLVFSDSQKDKINTSENFETEESAHSKIHASSNQEFWTCSMHPQVMLTDSGDCPICGMDLIPAEGGDQGLAPNEIRMSKNAMALANVQTTIVGNSEENGENSLSLSGKIAQNAEKMTVQASYFDGRIEKLNVNFEGQEIQKGQLLATIYAPELVAAQQELLTAVSMKESQTALYNAVRKKLKLWKLSENQINSIEKSGNIQEYMPVYATVSGIVSEVMSATGDYVKTGQPLLKVSDLGEVWAEFDAYENQLNQLKEGDSITVSANAYPNKIFRATVTFIQPTLNTQSRTVRVRATLDNKDDFLKPGMFITGNLSAGNRDKLSGTEVVNIPQSAVLWTGERSLVYVKTDKNAPIFVMREVTLGNRQANTYVITSGLQSGEEIVTNGTFTIDAAAQLQDKRSMMNSNGKLADNTPMSMELPEGFQLDFIALLPDYM
ncbi:MAG: efflux RND transporter periplasmic adaptor subunit, partial [Leeuwenhoekiella sp.]